MKRIAQILKGDNFIAEHGYIIVDKGGLSVYNGQLGIRFSRKLAGERLCTIADKHGTFALPEPTKFLKAVPLLENITDTSFSEKENAMIIRYGAGGKGILKVPVITGLSDQIPHLLIQWKNYEEAQKDGIQIGSLWKEALQLTSVEGEALWGNAIGLYGIADKLVSFDHGIFLQSEDVQAPEFFAPRSLLNIGLTDVQSAIIEGDQVFLVGPDVQYVCTGVARSPIVNDMVALKDKFDAGEKKTVSLNFTSALWKRAKLFANVVLTLQIKNGEMFVYHDDWRETIGTTEAPDNEFTTRITLLERWASGTLGHQFAIADDGTWYLHGKTRGSLAFYAVLTDLQGMDDSNGNEELVEDAGADMTDITEGATVL